MGNLFRIIGLLLATLLAALGLNAKGLPQDPVKPERHIKIVKVTDGKKMVLDTIVINDKPFVWMGDTIKPAGSMKLSRVGKAIKSGPEKNVNVYEFRSSGDKSGKNLMFITSDDDEQILLEKLEGKADSSEKIIIRSHPRAAVDKDVLIWHDGEGKFDIRIPDIKTVPPPPVPPRALLFNRNDSKIIDLTDPGIISYKLKKLKNGTEKIEIIRKEIKESTGSEMKTGVMIAPAHEGRVRVIRESDRPVRILEGGKAEWIESSPGEGRVEKIIKEDGKLIHIEEIKTDKGENEVKVKVEVKDEKPAPDEKKK